MVIITSGKNYIDLDALASSLAYFDLLKLEGKEADVVLAGPLNHSVTPTIRSLGFKYSTELKYLSCDFVLVDVSEASHFPKFVDQNRIIELYDHHYGFEKYWQERLGEKAVIEPIGACATLIWEQYEKRGKDKAISTLNANLLIAAIISNTLNLKGNVTSQKDKNALEKLKKFSNLPESWIRQYFEEQEDSVFKNIEEAIVRDTKVMEIPALKSEVVIGQLELWDGRQFINTQQKAIADALSGYNNDKWFFICPSIEEGKTYIYSTSDIIKRALSNAFCLVFKNNISILDKLYLRKEIVKKLYGIQQRT